jgi:hypothetical protein
MKTIFDKTTRDGIIARIKTLNADSKPQWGKMNIYQAMEHCVLADELYLGEKKVNRIFLGRILGKIALKALTKDEEPMRKNAPTHDVFKVQETTGDVIAARDKWIALLEQYADYSKADFVHWFFGKMTREQIGYLAYKHADHHLRQFGS